MNVEQYVKAGFKAGVYTRKAWVLSIFSVTKGGDTSYPYAITRTDDGVFFNAPAVVDALDFEDPTGEQPPTTDGFTLERISDAKENEPLITISQTVNITTADCPNVEKPILTTYGNLLINYLTLVWPFYDKIKYINATISPKDIEDKIEKLLVSNPEGDDVAPPGMITVAEYIKYAEAMSSVGGYTQLCVPSASRKTILPPPGIKALRKKLLAENEGHLDDPVVIAKIDKALVDHDKAWLADDADAMGFYMKDKSLEIVRKRQYLMHGAEPGFEGGVDLIENSLDDGWDIKKLPAMVNSLRVGSYNRGALTALGGESVKYFYRIMQNVTIIPGDCGSKGGIPHLITNSLVGFNMVIAGKPVMLTDDNVGKYKGSIQVLRSPVSCKTPGTDFCEACMGLVNSRNPQGMGAAAAVVGSTFMGKFMALMHGEALILVKADIKSIIT